jgi:hypothetical protein
MIATLTAYEREAVRAAVKEASARAKAHRERWAVGRTQVSGQDANGTPLVAWQGLVEGDAADVFVETLALALRRSGGFIIFLE